MAVTGRQLLDFVNARGDDEHGVCQCGHWWEEHHDGTCDACLENAAVGEPTAAAKHQFVYSDEATGESEYLNERARELGFPFERRKPPGLKVSCPTSTQFCDRLRGNEGI